MARVQAYNHLGVESPLTLSPLFLMLFLSLLSIFASPDACGAWPTGSRKKKWSDFACIPHRPDSARSEYFLLDGTDNVGTNEGADEGLNEGPAARPVVVVSRVWKTGSTALGQVRPPRHSRPSDVHACCHWKCSEGLGVWA